jgi:hypothetical protein
MADRIFVGRLAMTKGLSLHCHYRYELRDRDNVVYWAYYLSDIEKYLNEECVHA